MELHQIRYFLALAETLNVTRAAERCGVTQPALTRAIKKLEEELGGPLLRRERSRSHLTELGRVMKTRLEGVLRQASEAQEAARQVLGLEKASLDLGVMCTIGPASLMGFLQGFQAAYPGIELRLHDITPCSMTEALMAGELDAALLGLPTPLHERFDSLPLYRERVGVVCGPDHAFSRLPQVPLAAFQGERYLDRINCEFRSVWFELLAEKRLEVTVPYQSEREDWIQAMAAAGMGLALMPRSSATDERVLFRPIVAPEIWRSVELVTVAGRERSPALTALLRAAKAGPWRDID